jgi:PHP family Zn ribbon phosphoesterase
MEVTSAEEVHLVTLFPDEDKVMQMQDLVYQQLQPGENDPKFFGEQIVVNELDEVEGFNERLLISATMMPIEQVVDAVHELDGLVIASHVDREMFGLIGQLGMIPEGLALDAIEISKFGNVRALRESCQGSERFPIVRSSDAHEINDLGTITTQFRVENPTFDELRMALRGEGGREVLAP